MSVRIGHAAFEIGSLHVFPEYLLPFIVYVGMQWIPASCCAAIAASIFEFAPELASKPPLEEIQLLTKEKKEKQTEELLLRYNDENIVNRVKELCEK